MMVCALAREGFYQTCDEGPPLPTHAVSGGALVLLHRGLRDALSPTMSHSRSWSEIRTCGTCDHFFQKPTSKSPSPPLSIETPYLMMTMIINLVHITGGGSWCPLSGTRGYLCRGVEWNAFCPLPPVRQPGVSVSGCGMERILQPVIFRTVFSGPVPLVPGLPIGSATVRIAHGMPWARCTWRSPPTPTV